jgi:translation initiation factor 2 beta subunit (eIF-2beta)/eIF-5
MVIRLLVVSDQVGKLEKTIKFSGREIYPQCGRCGGSSCLTLVRDSQCLLIS